jgi:hypothetical protein
MSHGGRRRWWTAPGAPVIRGEVRSRGNLGGKHGGGGAHREAEVAAMVAPKLAEWRGVRCPRRASRACNVGREGDGARAQAKGTERRAMGAAVDAFEKRLSGAGQRGKIGGRHGRVRVEAGEGEEGAGAVVGRSRQAATTPDHRVRATLLPRE